MSRLLGGIEGGALAVPVLALFLASGAQPASIPGAALSARAEPASKPASTLAELWVALGACTGRARLPLAAAGSEITVLVTLRRDGSLLGRPRITHSRLVGAEGDRRDFVAAALAALAACFPLPITDGLGGAVAGRPLRYRIVSGARPA